MVLFVYFWQAYKNQKMIYIVGTIVTFFLAFLLIGKKNKNISDKILVVWFLIIGLHLSLFYLNYSRIVFSYPDFLGIAIIFPLIHGPLLYLYTGTITNQITFSKIQLLHFIPIVLVVLLFEDFFVLDGDAKLAVYRNSGLGFQERFQFNYIVIKISGVVYILWSQFLLYKHKKNIVTKFSNIERINLYWLQYLILGVGFVWTFVLFNGAVKYLYIVVAIFVIFMGYFGVNQVGIFNSENVYDKGIGQDFYENKTLLPEENIKYRKSGLDQEKAQEIYNLLSKKMEEEELYLNPDLNLVELAQIFDVHPNHLSQVINSFEDKNFYEYVNQKRIERFLSLIKNAENKKFTLLSIAYDCGFNSKSAFNRQFKKVMHQTPTEYINSL